MWRHKKEEIFTNASTFSPLRKTSEYNWAEGFSQVSAHRMCTLEITKIHLLESHTWNIDRKHMSWACAHLSYQSISLCSEHFSFPVKIRTQSSLYTEGIQSWPQMTEQSSRLLFTYPERSVRCWVHRFPGGGWIYHWAELSPDSAEGRWGAPDSSGRESLSWSFFMLLLKKLNCKRRMTVSWHRWVVCPLEQGRVCFYPLC